MPYELSLKGTQYADISDKFDRQSATKILLGLKAEVAGKKGVVKLMHAGDPKRRLAFDLKRGYQFYAPSGSSMQDTSVFLKALFRQALEGCDATETAQFLLEIDNYLQAHDNRLDAGALATFVNRLEGVQIRSGVGMESYAWSDPGVKLLNTGAEIEPWRNADNDLFGGSIQYVKRLGEGAMADVYLVRVPVNKAGLPGVRYVDRALKVDKDETKIDYYPLTTPSGGLNSEFPLMRRGDFAASRFKSGKGLIRSEYYYVNLKEGGNGRIMGRFRVSAEKMKSFIRESAEQYPDAYIGIYATLMPLADGEEVEKLIASGTGNKLDVRGPLQRIAAGAYKALNKLHRHGFAHNDIKPANMFYNEDSHEVDFIDTGFAQKHSRGRDKGGKSEYVKTQYASGTPAFVSPRITHEEARGPETDFHALACTLLVATEPNIDLALRNIFAREINLDRKRKGREAVLYGRNPENYLRIILAEAKKSTFPNTVAAAHALEQKLIDHPDFKSVIVDSFIVSSGEEPAATDARARLARNPYLNPPPENKPALAIDPVIAGDPVIAIDSLRDIGPLIENNPALAGGPAIAIDPAFTAPLSPPVPQNNPGPLPFISREDVALQKQAEEVKSSEAMKTLIGLRAQVAGKEGVIRLKPAVPGHEMTVELTKWYQFYERGSSAMEDTSARLRGLFHQALKGYDEADKALLLGDLDAYLASRNNKVGARSFEALVHRLETLKSKLEVLQKLQNGPRGIGPIAASNTSGEQLEDKSAIAPWRHGALQIKSTGEYARETSYLVKVPISESPASRSTAQVERVIKVEREVRVYPINKPESLQDIMRRGDFAASRLKNEKNIIRPEEYYIAIQESPNSSKITYWRVGARELKSFVRDKARDNPDAQIGIYATVMSVAPGRNLADGGGFFSSPQEVGGLTRQVAHGIYQTMTDLHQRGFAHNDLKRDNIVYDGKTGGVTLIDSGLMHKYSAKREELKQSTLRRGTTGYMSPRVAQREPHGPETDYYSFACLLLTTTEPDFEYVLSRIYAQEYSGEEKAKGKSVESEAVLKDMSSGLYLGIMLEQGKRDPETREATERLEKKLRENPDFQQAVEDAFVISGNRQPFADKARQRLAENPYLRSQN